MTSNHTPDSWDQSGAGDDSCVQKLSDNFTGLNVNAVDFIPGRNIHAAVFVPSPQEPGLYLSFLGQIE